VDGENKRPGVATHLSDNGRIGRSVELDHVGARLDEAVRTLDSDACRLNQGALHHGRDDSVPAPLGGRNHGSGFDRAGDHDLEIVVQHLDRFAVEVVVVRRQPNYQVVLKGVVAEIDLTIRL
jgi:hypothetical protein